MVFRDITKVKAEQQRNDAERNEQFAPYAKARIRGAMLDEIRSMDWIPRSVHERIGLLQKTHTMLMSRLGRPPQDEEVATELKMSLEELNKQAPLGDVFFALDSTDLTEEARGFLALKPDFELAILEPAADLPHDERAEEFNEVVLAFLERAGHPRALGARG